MQAQAVTGQLGALDLCNYSAWRCRSRALAALRSKCRSIHGRQTSSPSHSSESIPLGFFEQIRDPLDHVLTRMIVQHAPNAPRRAAEPR
jgi:hypothetical protein